MLIARKIVASAVCTAAMLGATNLAKAQTRPTAPASAAASQPVGAAEVFARWDKDHNKTLSPEEFRAGWDQVQANLLVMKLRENFVAMDGNRNGVLEAAEYANLELVKKAGASAPPLSAFDSNKSQGLDFKEYLGFVRTMTKPKP